MKTSYSNEQLSTSQSSMSCMAILPSIDPATPPAAAGKGVVAPSATETTVLATPPAINRAKSEQLKVLLGIESVTQNNRKPTPVPAPTLEPEATAPASDFEEHSEDRANFYENHHLGPGKAVLPTQHQGYWGGTKPNKYVVETTIRKRSATRNPSLAQRSKRHRQSKAKRDQNALIVNENAFLNQQSIQCNGEQKLTDEAEALAEKTNAKRASKPVITCDSIEKDRQAILEKMTAEQDALLDFRQKCDAFQTEETNHDETQLPAEENPHNTNLQPASDRNALHSSVVLRTCNDSVTTAPAEGSNAASQSTPQMTADNITPQSMIPLIHTPPGFDIEEDTKMTAEDSAAKSDASYDSQATTKSIDYTPTSSRGYDDSDDNTSPAAAARPSVHFNLPEASTRALSSSTSTPPSRDNSKETPSKPRKRSSIHPGANLPSALQTSITNPTLQASLPLDIGQGAKYNNAQTMRNEGKITAEKRATVEILPDDVLSRMQALLHVPDDIEMEDMSRAIEVRNLMEEFDEELDIEMKSHQTNEEQASSFNDDSYVQPSSSSSSSSVSSRDSSSSDSGPRTVSESSASLEEELSLYDDLEDLSPTPHPGATFPDEISVHRMERIFTKNDWKYITIGIRNCRDQIQFVTSKELKLNNDFSEGIEAMIESSDRDARKKAFRVKSKIDRLLKSFQTESQCSLNIAARDSNIRDCDFLWLAAILEFFQVCNYLNFLARPADQCIDSAFKRFITTKKPCGPFVDTMTEWNALIDCTEKVYAGKDTAKFKCYDDLAHLPVAQIPASMRNHQSTNSAAIMTEPRREMLEENMDILEREIAKSYDDPEYQRSLAPGIHESDLNALLSHVTTMEEHYHVANYRRKELKHGKVFKMEQKPPADLYNGEIYMVPGTVRNPPHVMANHVPQGEKPTIHELHDFEVSFSHIVAITPYKTAARALVKSERSLSSAHYHELEERTEFLDPDQANFAMDTATMARSAAFKVLHRLQAFDNGDSDRTYVLAYLGPHHLYPYPYYEPVSSSDPLSIPTTKPQHGLHHYPLQYAYKGAEPLVSYHGSSYDLKSLRTLFRLAPSYLLLEERHFYTSITAEEFKNGSKFRFCVADGISMNHIPFGLATQMQRCVAPDNNGCTRKSWCLRVSSEYLDGFMGLDAYPMFSYYHESRSHPEYNNYIHGWGYHELPQMSQATSIPKGTNNVLCSHPQNICEEPANSHKLSSSQPFSSKRSCDETSTFCAKHKALMHHFEHQCETKMKIYVSPPSSNQTTQHKAYMVMETRGGKAAIKISTVDNDGDSIDSPNPSIVDTTVELPTEPDSTILPSMLPNPSSPKIDSTREFPPLPKTATITPESYRQTPEAPREKHLPATVLSSGVSFNEKADITFYDRKQPPRPSPETSHRERDNLKPVPYTFVPDPVRSNTPQNTPPLTQPSPATSRKSTQEEEENVRLYTFNDFYASLPDDQQAIIFDRLTINQRNEIGREMNQRQDNLPRQHSSQSFTPIRNTPQQWEQAPASIPAPSDDQRTNPFIEKILRSRPRRSISYHDPHDLDSEDEDLYYQRRNSLTCPSSEYLTKTLMKHAKNSRFRSLAYPSNLDSRRQLFNRFIDNLIIIVHISPWTKPLFDDWPNAINCDEPNVSIALFNVLHAYTAESCQKLISNGKVDGKEALQTLRRHCAPMSSFHIDTLNERFTALKQGHNETATTYFNRIRETVRDCYHAGIDKQDDQTMLKRALRGASKHSMYDTTYKSFQRQIDSAQPGTIPVTFIDVESAMHNIDEQERTTSDQQRSRNYNQHGAFFMAPSSQQRERFGRRPHSGRENKFRNNQSNHRGQAQNNENKTCSYCQKRYHTYDECRKRQSDQRNGSRRPFSRPTNNSDRRTPSRFATNNRDNNQRRPFQAPPQTNHNNRANHGNRDNNRGNNSNLRNQPNNATNDYAVNIICNACGQRGHFAARCPNQRNQSNNRNGPSNNQRGANAPNQRSPNARALNVYTTGNPTTASTNTPVEHFHRAFTVTANQNDLSPRNASEPPLLTHPEPSELNVSYETVSTFSSSNPSEQHSFEADLPSELVLPTLLSVAPTLLRQEPYQPEDPLSLHQRYGPPELHNWIPDSGATLHFTPVLADLINPAPCNFSVTMADGTTRMATAKGDILCKMTTDEGTASMFLIADVFYVNGLNHRLLSLNCISSTENHSIVINNCHTVIRFPDQSTFTWPMTAPIDPDFNEHQAFMVRVPTQEDTTPDVPNNPPENDHDSQTKRKIISRGTIKGPTVSVELMSQRMGFRNIKTLLTGSLHDCWRDTKLTPGTHSDNWPVQVSISHKHARGKTPMKDGPTPFYSIHYDIIRNPYRFGLSTSSFYTAYLLIVATPGRLIGWKGLKHEDTVSVLKAQQDFLTETRLLGRVDTVQFIRTDAGTAFYNDLFISACNDLGIQVEAASPKHQEMNGICEAKWKQLHTTANTMLNNARLGGAFYHHAHKYAAAVLNALPARNVTDADGLPSTPYFVCYNRKPTIRNFRTFGCPVYIKRYTPSKDKKVITHKQQTQRATRGIFVGFPDHSAGWLIYCAELNQKFAVSSDVQFDEQFQSALVFDSKPFAGAVPIRSQMDPNGLSTDPIPTPDNNARTGNVADLGTPNSRFLTEINDKIKENNNSNDFINAYEEGTFTTPSEEGYDDLLKSRYPAFNIEEEDYGYSSSESDNSDAYVSPDRNTHIEQEADYDQPMSDDDTVSTTCSDDEEEDDIFVTPIPCYVEEPDTYDQSIHPTANIPIPPLPRRISERSTKGQRPIRLVNALQAMKREFRHTNEWSPTYEPGQIAILQVEHSQPQTSATDSTPIPIDQYLPEPQSLKAVLALDDDLRKPWLDSILSELTNLIKNNTFILGHTPGADELTMLVKLVLKAKQNAEGDLEKLKARIVARGDMEKRHNKKITRKRQEHRDKLERQNEQKVSLGLAPHHIPVPTPIEDTWTPCATTRGVKLFIASVCSDRRTVKSGDFVGAYLQANVVGRHFVKLPIEYAELFPQYAEYFGVPLLLGKGIYGITYAGKWWNIEYSEWLLSQGFLQSSADPTYFVKRFKNGQWLRLTFFVDDLLYAGSNDKVEREFETSVQQRFDIKFNGDAQWFLQMRIHKHADETYTLDQYRYVKNTLKRYDPSNEYKMRSTPLPTDYIYSKENKPSTEEAQLKLNTAYTGLDFRSAVCTLLYLAYNTRADILFAVTKLSKACICPGEIDYKALIWLFGYLKFKPDLAVTFYPDRLVNPITKLCNENAIPFSDITIFTDASWQDCPDTGRSTVGYMIFYRGALIEANCTVPTPVAMATSEAEYMAACCGTMAAAHIRMILYDILYLGTNKWQEAFQNLPTTPIVLMCDNQAAVQIAKNGKLSRKSRHVERRWHWVRQGERMGLHSLHWLKGEKMLSDILTKTQYASKIDPHLPYIFTTLPKHLTK